MWEETNLDDDDTLVEAHGDLVCVSTQCDTPGAFECIAEGILEPVRVAIPNLDRPVLTATDDDWEIGMEDGKRGVIGVSLHSLYAAFGEVIPDLDGLVITGSDEIGTIGTRIKIDAINTLIVCFHCEVGMWRAEGPHFDGAIETGRRERVCVFWVECNVHDVVRVSVEYLHR